MRESTLGRFKEDEIAPSVSYIASQAGVIKKIIKLIITNFSKPNPK